MTYSYTDNGRTATVKDAKDNLTTCEYDGFDRLTKTRYPSPTTPNSSSTTDYEQPGYEANGNVTALRLRDGQSIGFAYDNLNRLTFKDLPGGEPDVSYAYDLIGRLTVASKSGNVLGFTYDALNRNLTQTGPLGTVTATWDIGGRRTRLDLPGGYYTTYDYLVTGEMTAIRESGAASGPGVLATFGYNDLGNRTGLSRGNGTGTGYTPDAISRLSSLSQDLASTASDQTLGFSYNPASQIIARASSNDAYAMRQQYNASRGYTVNGLNQYTVAGSAAPTYAARGNMTNAGDGAIVYTPENMMSSAPGAGAITYDPAMRLYQLAGSGTTRFLYDGNDLVAEYDGAGTLLRRYVHGPEPTNPSSGTRAPAPPIAAGCTPTSAAASSRSATALATRLRSTPMTNGAIRSRTIWAGSAIPDRHGWPTSACGITKPACTIPASDASCRPIPSDTRPA
jgi:YD repeat-containing protein